LAHTNCGAVKAALKDYSNVSSAIKRELNHLEPAIGKVEENQDFKQKWLD
jgi:carbonic anhydrase